MTGFEYLGRRDLHPFWDGYSDPNREDVADAYENGKGDGYSEGLDACARRADEHPHWISVKDELPEEDGVYLFFDAGTQGVYVSFFWADLKLNEGVTHWMPLPAPPEKGGEQ